MASQTPSDGSYTFKSTYGCPQQLHPYGCDEPSGTDARALGPNEVEWLRSRICESMNDSPQHLWNSGNSYLPAEHCRTFGTGDAPIWPILERPGADQTYECLVVMCDHTFSLLSIFSPTIDSMM